ncbi:hypothetical protein QZH41_013769 [Actinostola sp. cb2023]|nr:hypothetical protein QZH41_013769 [Actinostola sp. cb2023]
MGRNGRVKVFVRIRPTSKFADNMIELLPDGKSINIHCEKDQRRGYINNQILDWSFSLDRTLHNASQEVVYEECAKDILTSTLGGCNGTIMAYGQTGAGKTFTMTGSTERFEHRGIIPRAIQQLFREISQKPDIAVTARVSYMEIYNEYMYDLLATLPGIIPMDPSLMTVTEDSHNGFTRVKGLSIHTANNEEEALNLLFELSTLRFGSRMMSVPCEPATMEFYDSTKLCKEYEKEIMLLRKELAMHDTLTNRSQISYEPLSFSQVTEVRDEVKRFLEGDLTDIELVNVRQIQEMFDQFKSIVNSLESDMEEKLKQKYILHERSENGSASVGRGSGRYEGESGFVGEVDGKGFGIGVAGGNIKANMAGLASTKRSKSRKSRDRDSTDQKSLAGTRRSPGREKPGSPIPSEASDKRLSTPPLKGNAFEEFKKERGSEINRILSENKGKDHALLIHDDTINRDTHVNCVLSAILKAKRQTAKELSTIINTLKNEMDQESVLLQGKTEERLQDGQFVAEDGQVVIDEDEFHHLKKLKELKAKYRENYEELQNIKSEVFYCEKLVNQCRQRLLTEFDSWYTESFLGPDEQIRSSVPGVRKVSREGYVPEDEQEKFDRLQLELLMEHPDSVPYYNAKMQTERRMHLTASRQRKSKPGTVVMTIKNKPPSTLTVT